MKPYFSIIIPSYNRAAMLKTAVESVLSQTYNNWELVIVDDGSTDNTREIIAEFNDNRIKYIYQQNQERSAARNNGIKHAEGKYICFLDSDDHYLPQRLELLNAEIMMRSEPVALFYTGIGFENNGVIIPHKELKNEDKNQSDFIVKATIGVPQTCIHSEILKTHQFHTAFRIGEDLELWLRIICDYPLIYIDNNTVVANEHDERSVNLKKYNSGKEELQMLKFIFAGDHPGNNVSSVVRKQKISNAYFNMAKYNIFNGYKRIAAANLFRSIFACPAHKQTKHKIYVLLHLLTGSRIKEYSNA